MNDLEAHIKIVSDKLQQLLRKIAVLQKENEALTRTVNNFKEREENYKEAIFSLNQKVNILTMVSGNLAEADQKEFERRIDQYVREIDKCIRILSE